MNAQAAAYTSTWAVLLFATLGLQSCKERTIAHKQQPVPTISGSTPYEAAFRFIIDRINLFPIIILVSSNDDVLAKDSIEHVKIPGVTFENETLLDQQNGRFVMRGTNRAGAFVQIDRAGEPFEERVRIAASYALGGLNGADMTLIARRVDKRWIIESAKVNAVY